MTPITSAGWKAKVKFNILLLVGCTAQSKRTNERTFFDNTRNISLTKNETAFTGFRDSLSNKRLHR